MSLDLEGLKYRVTQMVGDGDISLLFNEIRKDLANKILNTQRGQTELRETLYYQAEGLQLLEDKFQEYLNDVNRTEENN
ncbi:MAG: hypothetical protein ACRC6V_07990 [Bacteroidales bacterium]